MIADINQLLYKKTWKKHPENLGTSIGILENFKIRFCT